MNEIFKAIDELNLNKVKWFSFGKFCYAFLNKEPVFINELLPLIESLLEDNGFQMTVMLAYNDDLKGKKEALLKKFNAERDQPYADAYYTPQFNLIDKQLKVKTLRQLIDCNNNNLDEYPAMLDILSNSYNNLHGEDGRAYIRDNYAIYSIGLILYLKNQTMNGVKDLLDFRCSTVIVNEYDKIGIDIKQEDSQFEKYKIVSLSENVSIFNDKDSQTIRDKRIDLYFWISVPRKLLLSFEELINKGMVSKLAFRVDNITECIPFLEEMEFGSPMRLNISSLPKLSKFYSTEKYDNALWIHHDIQKKSLIFEEMMEDFKVVGDDVVTQVIHLEYSLKGDGFSIVHLDHEYIIYTLENYSDKLNDSSIKGHRKVKTFKIDESEIPFNIKIGEDFFLFQVLDAYFKNEDLIYEYFDKIN